MREHAKRELSKVLKKRVEIDPKTTIIKFHIEEPKFFTYWEKENELLTSALNIVQVLEDAIEKALNDITETIRYGSETQPKIKATGTPIEYAIERVDALRKLLYKAKTQHTKAYGE